MRTPLGLPGPVAREQLSEFDVIAPGTGSPASARSVACLRVGAVGDSRCSAAAFRPRLAGPFAADSPVQARLGLFWLAARPR